MEGTVTVMGVKIYENKAPAAEFGREELFLVKAARPFPTVFYRTKKVPNGV